MPRKTVGTQVATQDTPLTPEERRALVEKPFPAIRHIGPTYSWGGTSVVDWCGEKPSRAYTGGGNAWLKLLGE